MELRDEILDRARVHVAPLGELRVEIDPSPNADLKMDSAPVADAIAPTPTVVVSGFQVNMISLRLTHFVSWVKLRSDAAAFIQVALA